jgi:hypothetical protein
MVGGSSRVRDDDTVYRVMHRLLKPERHAKSERALLENVYRPARDWSMPFDSLKLLCDYWPENGTKLSNTLKKYEML